MVGLWVTWILMMLSRNPLFACRVFFRNPIRAAQCDGTMSTFVVLPYTCSGGPRRHTSRCTLGSWRHSRARCMTVGRCRCAQMMSCLWIHTRQTHLLHVVACSMMLQFGRWSVMVGRTALRYNTALMFFRTVRSIHDAHGLI
jgi:hypothetical protein